MCRALSDPRGGYRCPSSGGVRPCPQTRKERRALAVEVERRRDANRRAALAYKARAKEQVAEAESWLATKRPTADKITAYLNELPERGHSAERKVLEAALAASQGQGQSQVDASSARPERKKSKALLAAEERLELARQAGASPETLALMESKVAKLTPKAKTKPAKPEPQPVAVNPYTSQVEALIKSATARGEDPAVTLALIEDALKMVPDGNPEYREALTRTAAELRSSCLSVPLRPTSDESEGMSSVPTVDEVAARRAAKAEAAAEQKRQDEMTRQEAARADDRAADDRKRQDAEARAAQDGTTAVKTTSGVWLTEKEMTRANSYQDAVRDGADPEDAALFADAEADRQHQPKPHPQPQPTVDWRQAEREAAERAEVYAEAQRIGADPDLLAAERGVHVPPEPNLTLTPTAESENGSESPFAKHLQVPRVRRGGAYDQTAPVPPSGHRIPTSSGLSFAGRVDHKLNPFGDMPTQPKDMDTSTSQPQPQQPLVFDAEAFKVGLANSEARKNAERQALNAERAAAVKALKDQGVPELAWFEPEHVVRVAKGEGTRWIKDGQGSWVIAAPAADVQPDNTVIVHRKDGSASVERVAEVLAHGTVDGTCVAILRPAPSA
ncbi:hypothetical protein KIH27_16095 [Mycobacterium sp. M1]|uniref:Uncharacterized protein n=1 Tax=Mycolicibacter acidiphilus TaxID=2835306 RepID=A0ABS5RLC2_9MYCO|nr:hypothetical protein [Mycolicibacter acidiphilus]MBS9535110.1 hypothetical protein [Mycolicibacter acidiphilus]